MYILYSAGTPNGLKPTILLEELSLSYQIKMVDIKKGEQFHPDFLKISPNNKIPVLHDDANKFYLFESVAILQYLAEQHKLFLPSEITSKYTVLEWCFFQAAHIGPMFGQLGHFAHFATDKIPYAIDRYEQECARLMKVLDNQLQKHHYIAGAEYSIADMAVWPWLYCYETIYQQNLDKQAHPNLVRWYIELYKRPTIISALTRYGLK